jgi:hypothetical protein|tara:strand:- start:55 stop:264 length:210 start_codon:yes stop_codon:yes gene_type:complete
MIMLTIVIPLLTTAFISNNAEFFDTANVQIKAGASWHYVEQQPLDPTAKALSLQVSGGEPYILFKLKEK